MSGRMKLSSDHSSARLFCDQKKSPSMLTCSGVPVRIKRFALVYDLSSRISLPSDIAA